MYVDGMGFDAARDALLMSINEGTLLVHFLGHSNLVQMGNGEGLLRSEDVADLSNADRQPVLLAMTCAIGRFDRVFLNTLGESLLLEEDGGITALWAPTGLTFNREGVKLSEYFNEALFSGMRLGDAVGIALKKLHESQEYSSETLPYLYTLLGDPAMKVVDR